MDRQELQKNRRARFGSIRQIYSTARQENRYVSICAPMVRYSRLPFRALCRKFNVDVCFSPMLISDSFINSASARDADLRSNVDDGPLVVQFAANKGEDFAQVAQMLYGHCEGIDLNCGCPQRWVNALNYGDILMKQPELLADIVLQARRAIPDSEFSISVKTRVFDDLQTTLEMARRIEKAGATMLSIHGRTHGERDHPVRVETISTIVDTLSIPVNYNGSIRTREDAQLAYESTGVGGVMVARGLLHNPGLFDDRRLGDPDVLTEWTKIALELGIPYSSYHKHLMYMLDKVTTRPETRVFNSLQSMLQAVIWLRERNYIYC